MSRLEVILAEVRKDIQIHDNIILKAERTISRLKAKKQTYEIQGLRLQYKAEIHKSHLEVFCEFGLNAPECINETRDMMFDQENNKKKFLACQRGEQIMLRKIGEVETKITAEEQTIHEVQEYIRAMKRHERLLLETA